MTETSDLRELSKNTIWDAIVITLTNPKWRNCIENECQKLSKAGLFPAHKLLVVVEDPQPSGSTVIFQSLGVGSGGATLNGLLVVAERLSALAGYTTINSDVLQSNLILMIHFGRSSHHIIGGNTFIPLSAESTWIPPSLHCPFPVVILQNAVWIASLLATKSTTGIWLSSVDFWIPFSNSIVVPNTTSVNGALLCSLSSSEELKFPCGIISSTFDGLVQDITYLNFLEENGKQSEGLNIVSGCTFISSGLAENILALHILPPLDRCTYYGTDSNTEPVQLSLYFDLLLPMCQTVNEELYIIGELTVPYAKRVNYNLAEKQEAQRARHHIWKQLRGKFVIVNHPLKLDCFSYLHPFMNYQFALGPPLRTLMKKRTNSISVSCLPGEIYKCRSLVNCSLTKTTEEQILILDCNLGPKLHVEVSGNCIITNFQLADAEGHIKFGSNLIWHMWPLEAKGIVITSHGLSDEIYLDVECEKASIFNSPTHRFMKTFDMQYNDLWGDDICSRNFLNARIFPLHQSIEKQLRILEVLTLSRQLLPEEIKDFVNEYKSFEKISFQGILMAYNVEKTLKNQDGIILEIIKDHIRATAKDPMTTSFLPLFAYVNAISFDSVVSLLHFLHDILKDPTPASPRLLANIADLLGFVGGPAGGLRSGPAANREWVPALNALKNGNHRVGMELLRSVCLTFVNSTRPENLIRASRHYERASQILISKQVETASEQVFPLYKSLKGIYCLPKGVVVKAFCPARLDLAGGWTDTPPVCYEQGGAVLNVAIKVNGKKPIGAEARIISPLEIVSILRDSSGGELRLSWTRLDQLKDFSNPVAPGALVKAILVFTEFINLEGESLQLQLRSRYNGGLEVVVWSELAQGSGLGGSSLIAGSLLGALALLMGFPPPTPQQLIHATLTIEQMLTTGGGWQDQVGGLVGGLKLGVSNRGIPLRVQTYSLPLSQDFLQFLNDRLFLLYTGKVRLARNLLQTVLRNWYARMETVTKCFSNLRLLALDAAMAALDESGPMLGSCISQYWDLKKRVASGCEPAKIAEVMSLLKGKLLGQSLAGAGGGGYLYGLSVTPFSEEASDLLQLILEKFPHMTLDRVEIDSEGLVIEVGAEVVVEGGSASCQLTPAVLKEIRENL